MFFSLMSLSALRSLITGSTTWNSTGSLWKVQCCVSWNQIFSSLNQNEGTVRFTFGQPFHMTFTYLDSHAARFILVTLPSSLSGEGSLSVGTAPISAP